MRVSYVLLLVVAVLLTSCSSTASNQVSSLELYVFDCGELGYEDISAFGLTNDESVTRRLFVPCYIVDHPMGKMLWDAGLDPDLAGKGKVAEGSAYMVYERSLVDQMADAGLTPDDIDLIALSHFHFDHAGAVRFFTRARLLIQRPEYEAAFLHPEKNPIFDFELYKALAHNPMTILDGDQDVFGDGSVLLLSAPGHTPGHQVLFLDLAETGPLVLSGDLYHFRESRELRRTPIFNTDKAQTLESMDKVEAFTKKRNATFWIEHDHALAQTLNLAPLSYR